MSNLSHVDCITADGLPCGLAASLGIRAGPDRRVGQDGGLDTDTDQALDESPCLIVEDCWGRRALS
jgi:hypothetical protein